MYHFVENKQQLKRAQNLCSDLMRQLEDELRENGINSQFFLIGSGAKNMVTQNAEEPFDFDYNLNILDCEDFDDCRYIKENVRKAFNCILQNNGLDDCDDSTSSLATKIICFRDDDTYSFSIDVGIVVKSKNKWFRLIHDKTFGSNRYYWNEAYHSDAIVEKVEMIKSVPGWWNVVRDEYLELKNLYLRRNDHYHPSFVCYIEAVNNVYQKMKDNRII